MIQFSWLIENNEPFPLFITRARRELIDSAVFLDFLVAAGAIVARVSCRDVVEMRSGLLNVVVDEISLRLNYFVWNDLACRECQEKSQLGNP